MIKTISVLFSILFLGQIFAQLPHNYNKNDLNPIAFINTVEQSLNLFYADYVNDKRYDSIINTLNYEPNEAPLFSDEIYCQRLEKINQMSTFPMDCNPITLSTIRFFASKRRSFARIVLGRSALYFDMFREKLIEYGLPEELRFLAVIESGLRPQVKSRAGALGLWQFMYRTGLQYGLEENNYIDDRMDPDKATDAACKFLKKLYGIYGDWNLALAAYNAGPGNVNKAIKRSGNKTTYWEIRPYLPSETQGYVPNFIAAAYLLTYHAEHNIIPMEAKVHYIHLDTVCLRDAVHMNTISKLLNWDLNEIKALNPVYKTTFIPKSEKGRCISGPNYLISTLAGMEDSLYKLEKSIYSPVIVPPTIIQSPTINDTINGEAGSSSSTDSLAPTVPLYLSYHKVKSQENLKNIALKYNVTVENIMEWNNLRSTSIYVGQKLKVYTAEAPQVAPTPPPPAVTKKYYNVRSGDTFGKIAQRHNLTLDQLKKINPGINISRLTVGQKIRVK
jgi:membrane-bound lytic murein transglycosylase D